MADTPCVLVVEDDPILKNLLGHSLGTSYHTIFANEGAQALSYLEEYKPSLMLLDLMMPNMDGFAVLQAVRGRTDALKDIPIIVVSNLSASTDKERATQLGATAFLVKAEVSIEEITTKIRELLPSA